MIHVEEEIYFRSTSPSISCIVLFIKGNKYVFLLCCLYNVHWIYIFFYCSYKKILFEGWGSYSPVLFSQYLFDLKFYWITCHHNKAEKLPKCNVKCKGVYLKGTNSRWFNQQVFFSDHLRTKAYIKIFTFPDSQDYMIFNNQCLF